MDISWKTNIYLLFSMMILELTTQYDCGPYMEHIVSGPNGVPDESLSASSTAPNMHALHDPKYGRLYMHLDSSMPASAWTAGISNNDQYIQAYPGNTDRKTVVRNDFNKCIMALYLRIRPKTWHNDILSLRMGFLGCSKRRAKYLVQKNTNTVNKKDNCMTWKRTSINEGSAQYISQHRAPHAGSCAISCHKMSLCVNFAFNQTDNTCVLLPGGNYQSVGKAAGSFIYSRYNDLAETNDYTMKFIGNKHVFYKIITEKKTQSEASQICAGDDGRLLVVGSSEILASIQEDIRTNLILSQEKYYFVDEEYSGVAWYFNTGKENTQQNHSDNCIVITAQHLEKTSCASEFYFVCEMLIEMS